MSHNINDLKRQYLEYIEIERGRSLKTVENYDRYLSRFISHTGIKSPQNIDEDLVRQYRLWLNRQEVPGSKNRGFADQRVETLKKRTQNYYLIALRSFLKYMIKRGVETMPPDRIDLAKVAERSIDTITNEELQRLLAIPGKLSASELSGSVTFKSNKTTNTKDLSSVAQNKAILKSLRDKAILELLFSTGLRVSELCSLGRDLDLTRDEFSIRGKGEKVRVVFLSDQAKEAIKGYLSKRVDMDEALFVQIGRAHV